MIPLDKEAALRKVMGMATYPGAVQEPGPAWKTGYPSARVNQGLGVICHSMVGGYAGALARLQGGDRASWHFSVKRDGTVVQHYDSTEVTWHAGSLIWNKRLIGIEHEGGAPGNEGEPLTAPQKAASVALVRWLSKTHGFPLTRFDGQSGALYEHRDVYATACPSGRIPWAEYEEEPMTDAERRELDELKLTVLDLATKFYKVAEAFKDVAQRVAALEGK